MKKLLLILLCLPLIGWSHDVSESTVKDMTDASLIDFIYFGAEHMVTGYDHILFLIGVVFFLSNYFDILSNNFPLIIEISRKTIINTAI